MLILFRRATWLFVSDPSKGLAALLPQVFIAVIAGVTFFKPGYDTSTIANAIFMMMMLVFMPNLLMTVVTVPLEKAVIMREYRNGTFSLISYWLARTALNILSSMVITLVSITILYFLFGLPMVLDVFGTFYLVCTLLAITAQMLSLVIGCSVGNAESAIQKVPPPMILFMLYAGLLVPKDKMVDELVWVYYINPFAYAFKIMMYAGCQGQGSSIGNGMTEGDKLLQMFSVDGEERLQGWLVLIGILLFLIFGGYFLARRQFL